MGTVSRITKISLKFLNNFRTRAVFLGEIRNINKKKNIYKTVNLSNEQDNKIDDFYKKFYGMKISKKWHKLYQSYTGIFDEKYFPEILFSTKLEPILNDYAIANFFQDKNLINILFGNSEYVRIPDTYISCVGRVYRDSKNNIIKKNEVINLMNELGKVIVKKTIETSSGRDVMVCNFQEGIDKNTSLSILQIVDYMGNDFIVQEKIKQCVELNKLYSNSLNTFRVVTYIAKEKICSSPLSLRLGQGGSEVDNVHFGGIVIGVSEDGILRDKAFSEYGEGFYEHPDSKIRFDNYKIEKVDQLVNTAKKMHKELPHLKIISWDLSIDIEGNVILIEMNTIGQSVWFPQMINGQSMFGENTGYMLSLISKKR